MNNFVVLGDCATDGSNALAYEVMHNKDIRLSFSILYHKKYKEIIQWYMKYRAEGKLTKSINIRFLQSEAIKALDSNVYYVIQDGETFVAYDSNDKVVKFDDSAVNKKAAELQTIRDLENVREERNNKLTQSDWVVIKEREEGGSVSNFADWKKYRQELRDITNTYKSLDTVKWPTAPSE